MMAKTVAPMALALMLFALPAAAHERNERGHDAQRTDRREDVRVDALARAVERATDDLYQHALFRARHPRGLDRRALLSLRRLEQEADRFRWLVVRDRHRFQIARSFARLERALRDAEASLPAYHGRAMRVRFAQVERLVERLDWQLAWHDERGPGRGFGRRG